MTTKSTEFLPHLTTYSEFVDQSHDELGFWSLTSMMKFASTPDTSLGSLTTKDGIIVLLLTVLVIRRIKAILIPYFCSIGREMGRRSHGVEWEKDNEERIIKFGEYVFRLMYHSTVTIAGLCFFLDAPWWDEKQGGVGATLHHHPHHEIGVEMIWYYMIQGAYNVEAMLSLSELSFDIKFRSMFSKEGKIQSPVKIGWSDTCRGDFTEMFAHHVITNLLVIGSSHLRFSRIGTMVFMVHDISDVPVDVSKLLNFMKWKYMTISAFAILMITWIVTRLYILPFVIVKGIFDTCHLLYENEDIPATYYSKILVVFKGLLISITSLHVLWFVILLRILLKVITKGETHDLSEHKNGEDQLNVKSNKNKTL